MFYKDIFDIINTYLYNIEIYENKLRYRCSQCRKFYDSHELLETLEQSWKNNRRIYCADCRKIFGLFFTYKEFK